MKAMLSFICTTAVVLALNPVQAQEFAPQVESQGRIDMLNFGTYEAQISGYDYDVSMNVEVEIAGSYGAFTMLEEGMLVQFNYLQFDDGTRQIIDMQEVESLEEH
jgi:hypothetical protein